MFYHKNFSRGCAPHPLSLKTRFSLYHIKVLHLFANRLRAGVSLRVHKGAATPHTQSGVEELKAACTQREVQSNLLR